MEILTIMIIFVLVVLGATYIPKLFSSEPKQTKKTKTDVGVGKLNSALKGFARQSSFKYLPKTCLEKGDTKVTIDGMVIGSFGILAVVASGRNGDVFGNTDEKEWLQVTAGEKTKFENPIITANVAVRMVRDPITEAKIRNVVIECLPVFTDSKLALAVPRSCNVYKLKDFKKLLVKDKYQEEKGVDIDAVYNALAKYIVK